MVADADAVADAVADVDADAGAVAVAGGDGDGDGDGDEDERPLIHHFYGWSRFRRSCARIQGWVDLGSTVEVAGFGQFYRDNDSGDLSFRPL